MARENVRRSLLRRVLGASPDWFARRIVRVPVTCPSLPMPQHKCAGRIVLTAHGKRLGQTRYNLANGATARSRIRLRQPVSKLVATVESGPNALSRTTLAASR